MNQLATLGDAQLPAHVQSAGGQAAGLVTSESIPRITLRDASFILKKDGNEIKVGLAKPIQVVILGIDPPEAKRTAKQFYAGGWSEDSADAPDCYSNDGVAPDQSIAEPQCGNCAACPKNAWGSGHDADGNPSKGKACSDRKNLLVVLGGKHIDHDIFRLSVPPTSLKSLSTFGRELVRYNVNMHKIVTQISVDEDNSKAMVFSYAGFLTEPEANRMEARAVGAEVQEMIHPAALPAPAGTSMANPAPAVGDEDLDLSTLSGVVTTGDASAQEDLAVTSTGTADVIQHIPDGRVDASTDSTTDEVNFDSAGRPWDERIDGKAKNFNADGTWRLKRGASKELVTQVLAEYTTPSTQVQESAGAESGGADAVPADAEAALDDLLDSWGSGV